MLLISYRGNSIISGIGATLGGSVCYSSAALNLRFVVGPVERRSRDDARAGDYPGEGEIAGACQQLGNSLPRRRPEVSQACKMKEYSRGTASIQGVVR